MNVKVANLVAVQFGVLVGIASWLAYSRFELPEPRIVAADRRESPAAPSTAVAPISDLGSQVTRALEEDADREQDQSIGEQPVQRRCRLGPHRKQCSSTRRWWRSSIISKSLRGVTRAWALRLQRRSRQLTQKWLRSRRQFHPITWSRSRLSHTPSQLRLSCPSPNSSYFPISAVFRIDAGRRFNPTW